MLEIRYLQPFRLPSDHAHSIQILNTCRALAEAGARVTLMVRRNPERPVRSAEEGLAAYGLAPHPNLVVEWLPTTHKGIAGLAARFRIWRARGCVFYARHLRLAAWAARRGPVVIELHKFEEAAARAVAAARAIVTITSPLRDLVRERFAPSAPIEVIPDGVDLARFPPPTAAGPARLVYAGQFHDWKGVDVMIAAVARLSGVGALILGGRDDAGLRARAREFGVEDRIEWGGFVPQEEIARRLRRGDVGVVPTRALNGQEIAASPLKLFEYMAAGIPVIASDLPSIRDVVRDGENGLLFREGDPEALAAAARRAIAEGRALAERARGDVRSYTWAARARRIVDIIARL
ncbi:MAG: glycosyltransferase family 4 protein [Planctomycetes bacterium]|nr:glycosyltransferase family 4 protein [Planctomycetota bacterium]